MERASSDDLACPWCGRAVLSWRDLMAHLDTCRAYDAALAPREALTAQIPA